jgi:protoheme IX farnesyltransferase
MPNVHGVPATRRAIVRQQVLLLGISMLPFAVGLARPIYAVVAGVLGLAFLGVGLWGWRAESTTRWARTLFLASMPYLVLIYGALVSSAL